ncbi:MAG: filamentous hemagglutinin N-terminal domain-containing protein [Coleofasciculus sp. S288]|nr:filamentous hemagglutinin N-terminal domain-containing protein [Coleofasciculus sp. S288]
MREYQNLCITPLLKRGAIALTGYFAIASAGVLSAIPFGIVSLHVFSGSRAFAQNLPVPDDTLRTQITPNNVIVGGTQNGVNLFHSFSEFNIGEGLRVDFFQEPTAGIENILSRVTGTDPSDILGTLGVLGDANLFLLNPNGILLGPNAQLDLRGGSFVGTTASAIGFPNDGEFSVNSLVEPGNPLLTVNPSAFIYNQVPGPIINQSTAGLEVNSGQNLFLIGGEVRVENGGTLRAPGGRIELGGLADEGKVEIEEITEGSNPGLNFPAVGLIFPDGVERTDVILSNGAIVDVTGDSGGNIAINAQNVRLSGDSNVCAGIGANLLDCPGGNNFPGGTGSEAGNIVIDATEEVSLSQSSRITNNINDGATGNQLRDIFETIDQFFETRDPSVLFGSVVISADSLSLTEGASVSTSTFGDGNAGLVDVEANSVSISGFLPTPDGIDEPSRLASVVLGAATGQAGGITITTGSLSLTNGALLNTSTYGAGNTGAVGIEADSVSIDNAQITSNVEARATGNALGIAIEADSISLSNDGKLRSSTSGAGNAGQVILQTNGGTISLDDSEIFSNVEAGGVGAGGEIDIKTGSLLLLNGSQIQTLVRGAEDNQPPGSGNAGKVTITASNEIELRGASRTQFDSQGRGLPSAIFSTVNEGATGNAGNIDVEAESISLSDRARIDTNLLGSGTPGTILLKITDSISLTGGANIQSVIGSNAVARLESNPFISEISGSLADETETGATKTGSITVLTGELSLDDKSFIDASTLGQGDAGAVLVVAKDNVALEDGSGIYSQAEPGATGNAGGILMAANSLFLTDEALITVSSLGDGEAGGIIILAEEDIILRDDALIAALSASGQGGDIFLTSGDFLLLLDGSGITTDAFNQNNPNANGGNITAITKYLIAAPYNTNDIVANAVEGVGGNIFVFAGRLYDIEKRPQVFPSNDIDASSNFNRNGTVSAFDLNIDPTQGLTNLPENLIDPSSLIAEACAARGSIAERQKNQFINTRQGGLPPDPNAAFPGEAVVNDLEVPEQNEENTTGEPSSTNPTNLPPVATASPQEPELVEAQGWVYGENGTVIFTAQASTVTPTSPALTPASTCNNVETSLQPR